MHADGSAGAGALDAAHVEEIRERLLADPAAWPGPEGVESVGLQLMVSAMKSGITPPEALRSAPEVVRLWQALALDAAADADLSLAAGRLREGGE